VVVDTADLGFSRTHNRQPYTALSSATCLYCKRLWLVDLSALQSYHSTTDNPTPPCPAPRVSIVNVCGLLISPLFSPITAQHHNSTSLSRIRVTYLGPPTGRIWSGTGRKCTATSGPIPGFTPPKTICHYMMMIHHLISACSITYYYATSLLALCSV